MPLLSYWHFSFTVADLDRSVDFYSDMLGMELIHIGEGKGEHLSRLVGKPDAHVRQATLRIPAMPQAPSNHLLALVQYLNPRGEPIDTSNERPGTSHLAFQVEDLRGEYARLSALGVPFKSEPLKIDQERWKGGWIVYLEDPDGIDLEMIEMPSGS
jgi:catechol 2,3-dioxygenase-like lactoylglutathione lyase family enzyme